ncbi:MAG: hypothetical protein K8R46_01000 [Pirellulales bacterium]|nr:hypothetical protein [Pirellulales bacterium]
MVFVYDTQDDLWMKIDGFLPPGGLFNDVGICIIGDTIYAAGAEGPGAAHYDYLLIGQISPMPEPSSLMLAIVAAAGFFVFRVFRKRDRREL